LRSDILRELKNDGYEVPDMLNCTFLDLPNKKTAVKYLLQVFNQKTNPINEQSLNTWIDNLEISLDDIEIKIDDLHIDITEEIDIEELQPEEIKEDEVPEVKHTFVVKGDLFELIDEEQGLIHRVLCGDSTMIDDVDKVMNGEKADMVFTDPPYNLLKHKIETGINPTELFALINSFIKDNCFIGFTGQHPTLLEFLNSANDLWQYSNEIIWHKKVFSGPFQKIGRCHENLMIYKKGDIQYFNNKYSFDEWLENADYDKLESIKRDLSYWKSKANGKEQKGKEWYEKNKIKSTSKTVDDYYGYTKFMIDVKGRGDVKISTVWDIFRDNSSFSKNREESLHITQKPLLLISRLIGLCSEKQKDLVIDFFLGSGSTLIACQQTKRKCYGIELDEHYCGVVVTRWRNYMEKEGKKYLIKRNGDIYNLD